MMKLSLGEKAVKIEFTIGEKMTAFRRSLDIPLSAIKQVHGTRPKFGWTDLRAPGTFVPGLLKAGTYHTRDGKEFWFATRKPVIVFELRNHLFHQVVLSAPRYRYWQEMIEHVRKRR